MQELESPCEGTAVLGKVLEKLNPPPDNTQVWLREQLEASRLKGKTKIDTQYLLSSVLPGSEQKVGCVLTGDEVTQLTNVTKLPLRFWAWSNSKTDSDIERPDDQNTKSRETVEKQYQQQEIKTQKNWKPVKSLDLSAVGLREARSDADLQGFKPIKGKGPVGANLATLRMVARATELIPSGCAGKHWRVRRTAGSVPIHGMGQLAETMGLQTRWCRKFGQLHRLELPCRQHDQHYALLTKWVKDEC